jgi:hypothetical protein
MALPLQSAIDDTRQWWAKQATDEERRLGKEAVEKDLKIKRRLNQNYEHKVTVKRDETE